MGTSNVRLIAVFGATGAGKTTFINKASGGNLAVGHDVFSCTQDVTMAGQYQQDGYNVQLIDTPGFDDTKLTDAEILKRIAGFLKDSYEEGQMLSGIIFLHSIAQPRVTGTAAKNLRMFKKLCGQKTLHNLTFVTNMWSTPAAAEEKRREDQMISTPEFFGNAINNGAKVAQFPRDGSPAQARAIIAPMLGGDAAPLSIQQELVDRGLELNETAAGQTLGSDMTKIMAEHQKELQALRLEFQQANERDRAEIVAERQTLQRKLESIEWQLNLLKRPIDENRRSWTGVIRGIARAPGNLVLGTVDTIHSACHALFNR